jgi:sulfite exporter TauE/SafE
MMETPYLAAFMVALLGGVHCFGMCGGIVSALTLGLPSATRGQFMAILPFLLAYNGGRISSYTVAGILAGGTGAWAANLASVHHGQQVLRVVPALFMLFLGLYLGGWWQGLVQLERVGGLWWRYIEPLGRRLLPIRTPLQALGVGLVWGWLPCGLVYSALLWAVSTGNAGQGALLMLCFGLGTLPNLILMGSFAAALSGFVRKTRVRQVAGALVMALGGYQILLSLRPLLGSFFLHT